MEINTSVKTHKDLRVWQKGMELVEEIYALTATFPQSEIFGLTSQIRRSAVSIPSNIAEGAARGTKEEFIHFLYIALGSLAELETQLLIAQRLGFLTSVPESSLLDIKMPLLGLIKSLKESHQS